MSFDNPSDIEMGICYPNGHRKAETACGDCKRSELGEPKPESAWCIHCKLNPNLKPTRMGAVDNFDAIECVTCTRRNATNCQKCEEYK